jgi:hypothetical protein
MKILVCGDREWTDRELIKEVLSQWKGKEVVIIEGGARGADNLANECAKELGFKVITVEADWKSYGKAAGPFRNKRMLAMRPDLVIAFHDDLGKSKGTKKCVSQARAMNVEVRIISHKQQKIDVWVPSVFA